MLFCVEAPRLSTESVRIVLRAEAVFRTASELCSGEFCAIGLRDLAEAYEWSGSSEEYEAEIVAPGTWFSKGTVDKSKLGPDQRRIVRERTTETTGLTRKLFEEARAARKHMYTCMYIFMCSCVLGSSSY